MMTDENRRVMCEIGLNDPVTLTLPAHVLHGFIAAYGAAKWSCSHANVMFLAIQKKLYDPQYMKEREAEAQRQNQELHQLAAEAGFPGFRHPVPSDDGAPPPATGNYL
jgi:hypothetical protein